MGGNALKEVRTQRLNKEDFEKCEREVILFLKEFFPDALVDSIPSYAEKKDFGDLDVMISEEGLEAGGGIPRLIEGAKERFFSRQEKSNGHVLSFEYRSSEKDERGFQVDIIQMPEVTFDFAKNYFSFNDLGNLIGRTAHKMGLKFGHNGLWYVMKDGDHKIADVLLSRDFDKSLVFLGFKPERFRKGFDNLKEVYEYVGGSKYFNGDIYLLENQSYKSRVRDKKRPTYQMFLTWIRENNKVSVFIYPENKKEWLPLMFKEFPNFKKEYDKALEKSSQIIDLKEKFNAKLIAEWTGRSGQALGHLMSNVKSEFDNDIKMLNFLKDKDVKEIKDFVLSIDKKLDFTGYKTISDIEQLVLDARKARQAAKKEIKKQAALKNK